MTTESEGTEILRRLEEVEARLAALEARAPVPSPPAARPTPPPVPPVVPRLSPEPTTFTSVARSATSPPKARDLEERFGASLLAKVGMGVLVLGVVFFLKLAFDNGWIGLSARIVLGVVGGAALVGLAEILRSRRATTAVYYQVLAGGGVIIAYFSLFAAYALDDYRAATGMTLEVDAILLGALALGLAAYATWREWEALAGEALALGVATALFAHVWSGFALVYVLLFSAATAAAAARMRWPRVLVAAPVAALLTLALDFLQGTDATAVAVVAALDAVLFGFFAWTFARPDAEKREFATEAATFAALASSLGGWAVAVWALDSAAPATKAPVTLSFAVASAFAAFAARAERKNLAAAWGLACGVFVLAFPPIAWSGALVHVGWAVETLLAGALALTIPAFLDSRPRVSPRSLVLFGAAAGAVSALDLSLWVGLPARADLFGPGASALVGFAVYAASAVGLGLLWIATARAPAASRNTEEVLRFALVAATVAIALSYPPIALSGASVHLAWAFEVLAAGVVAVVIATDAASARLAALPRWFGVAAGALIALDLVAYVGTSTPETLFGVRADPLQALLVYVGAAAGLTLLWAAERRRGAIARVLDVPVHAAFLAAAALVALAYLANALTGYWVSVTWALLALGAAAGGFTVRERDLRLLALAIFAAVLGRVFLVDLSSLDLAARVVAFLVVGGLLLLASFLYARNARTRAV